MKRKRVPMSKERVLNICKQINSGISPAVAVNNAGLANDYLIAMREAGIVFKSIDGKTWQARMRIHDERYQKFLEKRKAYSESLAKKRVPKQKVILEPITTQKVGFFKRLWIKLFS